jgi:hypothetical protein
VSNKSGFLSSIIKRIDMERIANSRGGGAPPAAAGNSAAYYMSNAPAAPQAAAPAGRANNEIGGVAGLATLDPIVARKAAEMVQRGIMTYDDFDSRIVAGLRELGTTTAAVAVDRLGTSHMTDIRSRAGFFMGAPLLPLRRCFAKAVRR